MSDGKNKPLSGLLVGHDAKYSNGHQGTNASYSYTELIATTSNNTIYPSVVQLMWLEE